MIGWKFSCDGKMVEVEQFVVMKEKYCFPCEMIKLIELNRLRNVEILLLENAAVNKLYVNSYETD